jgi:hypothetical protein
MQRALEEEYKKVQTVHNGDEILERPRWQCYESLGKWEAAVLLDISPCAGELDEYSWEGVGISIDAQFFIGIGDTSKAYHWNVNLLSLS